MSTARGFSLVEVVVAIALLTGALVTLAQLLAQGVHSTAAAQYRTIASILAEQKAEQLRGEPTLADIATVEHVDSSGSRVCGASEPCGAAAFTVQWSIAPFPSVPGTVLIDVTVGHAHKNYGRARSFAVRPRSLH
jgi:prepilin-type N-terminal cleavage/methylation domain-containing protein